MLAILVIAYTFNFIDRQIVGILAVPIKRELALSDTQLGLLGGLAFALFYTFLGIPIARLADRKSRVGVMTVALALWSLMTAACGFAHSFGQLFMARLGVGVGEAGGVAPAYSVICDYFPSHQRARALSVYSFGIPIGSAAGIVLGGFITHWMSWRMAFITVGVAGLAIAPVLKATVREPARESRSARPGEAPPAAAASFGTVLLTGGEQAELLGTGPGGRLLLDDGVRPLLLDAVVPGAQLRAGFAPGIHGLRRHGAGGRPDRHLARRSDRGPAKVCGTRPRMRWCRPSPSCAPFPFTSPGC